MEAYYSMSTSEAVADLHIYDEAEARYQCYLSGNLKSAPGNSQQSLSAQVAQIRSNIKEACNRAPGKSSQAAPAASSSTASTSIEAVAAENVALRQLVAKLEAAMITVTARLDTVEAQLKATTISSPTKATPAPTPAPAAKKAPVEEEEEDDDEVDLFGSDDEEEDAEAARIREERLKAYAEKKSKKAGPIAKSSILIDCKPWDDETDLKQMEAEIKKITMDGLVWGAAKSQLMAFGISKLQILCTIEDEKVSVDDLQEQIEAIEELVQSTDIAAFNKI